MGLSIHGTAEDGTGDNALDARSFMELNIHGTNESDTGDAALAAQPPSSPWTRRKSGLPNDGKTAAAAPPSTATPPR